MAAMTTYLHTMVRITDPDRSRKFYEALGFTFSREMDIVRNGEKEATNYFFSLPGSDNVLELTYNHDGRTYEMGTAYGHIAIGVEDLDCTLETAATGRQVVGQAGLMIFDSRDWTPSTWADAGSHAQPELGWALMRTHWGCGYATEAAAAIRDWAHESRSIDLLVSLISSDNVRSQRVAERLGAIPTETVAPADTKRETVVWRHPPAARC